MKARPLILTPNQEDNVVEWLKSNEYLFNKTLNAYKDTEMKNRLWPAKADELQIETAILKTWFDSMQARFGKITKTVSGDGTVEYTERDQWILNHFDFVWQHILHIKGWTAGGLKVKLTQQAAAAATAVLPVIAHPDVNDDVILEIDNDEPLVSFLSTASTSWSGSSQPSTSTSSNAGKSTSTYNTALSVLEKHAEESQEL